MPPSFVRSELVPRRICAIVTVLAFGWSGCAVHTWKPAAEPTLASLQGETVRAVCRAGDVEMTVTDYSPPYLTGTCQRSSNPEVPCTDPARVDLRDCARVDARRPDAARTVLTTLGVLGAGALLAVGALVLAYFAACGMNGCD